MVLSDALGRKCSLSASVVLLKGSHSSLCHTGKNLRGKYDHTGDNHLITWIQPCLKIDIISQVSEDSFLFFFVFSLSKFELDFIPLQLKRFWEDQQIQKLQVRQ